MKIERFELRAYGPFTERVLDFSAGSQGLHVVYGANEAGKSSALRALSAALFGIPRSTPDCFLHPYPKMRLAMQLRNQQRARISFVRRKANKDPLWNGDESEPLSEGMLRAFLGNIDAAEFRRVFGLDHEQLRDGGDHLLDAAEGADAVIVGAALGVSELRATGKALEDEAKALFTARATKARINQAITEWKGLRKQLKERTLLAGVWTNARRDRERSVRERDEAQGCLRSLLAQIREREFVRRNRRRVARHVELQELLAELAAVPKLDAAPEEQRREAQEMHRLAQAKLAQCRETERDLSEALEGRTHDFGLLDFETQIESLRDLSITVAKGEEDRVRRSADADALDREISELAGELGFSSPLERRCVDELRTALGSQERCEALLIEHTRLRTSLTETAARRGERCRELAAHKAESRGADPDGAESPRAKSQGTNPQEAPTSMQDGDLQALELAIRSVRKRGNLDQERYEWTEELANLESTLDALFGALREYQGSREAFATQAVPGPEALEDFGRRFESQQRERDEARRKAEELRAEHAELDAQIEREDSEGDVPREEALIASRQRRGAQWTLVRRAWMEGQNVDAAAKAIDADRPLSESFSRSVERSDEIVDRLRRESARVAQSAQLRQQQSQLAKRQAALEENEQDRARRREALQAKWEAAWSATDFEARSFAAMKDALATRAQILASEEAQRRARRRRADIDAQLELARSELRAALAEAGVPVGDEFVERPVEDLLEVAEDRLQALRGRREAESQRQKEGVRLAREIEGLEEKEQLRQSELDEWQERFAVVTQGLPVREGDPPDAAPRVYRQVAKLLKKVDEAVELRNRIAKIDTDTYHLRRDLAAFVSHHCPDLANEDAADTVAHLLKRVATMQRDRQSYEAASQQLHDAAKRRADAELAAQVADQALVDLANEVGAESVEGLAEHLRRAAEKRELREEHDRIESELGEDGGSVEEAQQRVAALEGCDLNADLVDLRAQQAEVEAEAVATRDRATKSNLEFERLESTTGAAEIAEQAAGVAARLRDDVEQYARLTLAAQLLGSAVQGFRERHEAPMLQHASELFEALTAKRYTRIETDLDDQGTPHFLVREGRDSDAKRMDALSDGTRDQLYLSLVLGSLQHRFSAGAEPIPLVLDDILVHFDDARSAAALKALAAFSRTTQVILFTHHERVREQAESLAPEGATFLHAL